MQPIEIAARSIVLAHPQGCLMSLADAVAAVKKVAVAAEQTDLQIADIVATKAIEAGICLEFDIASSDEPRPEVCEA